MPARARSGLPAGGIAPFLAEYRLAWSSKAIVARWSRGQLRGAVARGDVTRIHPDVYCATSVRDDAIVRARAAVAWQPRGVVTGAMALHFYDPEFPAPSVVDLVVPVTSHPREAAGVRLHQWGVAGVTAVRNGVACAVAHRAVLDAWRLAPRAARQSVVYEALWRGVCRADQLAKGLAETSRIPDRRALERLLTWFAVGATSPLEVRARREVFRGAQFSGFEWQVDIALPHRAYRADMLHRESGTIVELDGRRYHLAPAAVIADRERDVELAAAGYVTVRLSWDDVTRRPEWCRRQVLAVVAARKGSPRWRPTRARGSSRPP